MLRPVSRVVKGGPNLRPYIFYTYMHIVVGHSTDSSADQAMSFVKNEHWIWNNRVVCNGGGCRS